MVPCGPPDCRRRNRQGLLGDRPAERISCRNQGIENTSFQKSCHQAEVQTGGGADVFVHAASEYSQIGGFH